MLSKRIIELTHPLSPQAPTWNGSCGFSLEIKKDYDEIFRVQQIKMHAGVGTHMDAPCHCIKGALSIADIPVEQLVAPACMINISAKAEADYLLSIQDIEEYEIAHGLIEKNSLVIVHTGWDRFWSNSSAYRNCDAKGVMHFPSISAEAAELLLKREIVGLAIDTISPDSPSSSFPVHHLLLGANKYIIENIANSSQLPPKGALVIALPLRAKEASEAPMRIIALI